MVQGWCFLPLVILYALATHSLVFDPTALWGSLAGAFVFIGFYYFIRSLTIGSISTNASIFRMKIGWVRLNDDLPQYPEWPPG